MRLSRDSPDNRRWCKIAVLGLGRGDGGGEGPLSRLPDALQGEHKKLCGGQAAAAHTVLIWLSLARPGYL